MNPPVIQALPPVLTTDEAAKVLRCSVETVARYVHNHALRATQIGRERRFRAEDVLDFIAARTVPLRRVPFSRLREHVLQVRH